jgi:LuxR family maltose regulon positive regulatory protein
MADRLLSTKLYIPRPRRELVHRSRLLERLDAGFRGKLTLVSAPAGYGKTTLVSDWIARSQIPAAWLSLDASDNDLARFISYLIAALQQIGPGIGADVQSILETDSDPPVEIEPLLTALVNDIAASSIQHPAGPAPSTGPSASSGQGFVLVLDDYHVIHELGIHQALDFLFDTIPPGMHMVMTSRADPPMPLGRLRVQRELTEIREADLRFTVEEATAFLNDLMGLALSDEDIENLESRTEGWIAGLQLAALTLQGRPDQHDQVVAITGSHRHVIDYLIHEVMSRQPEKVRAFLLHTSILEPFNAPLCDAVLDEGPRTKNGRVVHRPPSSSQRALEHLEQANLFIVPLDNRREWYRYHHLFADFLRQRLHKTQPEIVPQLYVRASQWYEAQGMVDEAIEHALAGDDVMRAARLLDENVETLILASAEVNKVLRWANRLPVDTCRRFPRLCVWHAWALQFEYQLEAAESALTLAEAHLADPEALAESFTARQITGHAAAVRAYMALHRGEFGRAVDLALAALEALPEEDTKEVLALRGAIALGLGIGYYELGQMGAAYQALQSALPLNQQVGSRYPALACMQYLMYVDCARGALNRALANGEKGLFWIEEWSRSEGRKRRPARMLAHLRLQMGMMQYERNGLSQAAEYLHKATEYYELVGSWSRARGYALLVDLHQALGDVEAALGYWRKLKQISLTPGISLADVPLAAMIAERSLLLSQWRPDLKHLLDEAMGWAETSGLRPDDEFRYQQEYEYLTLARVLIAQNRAEEAVPLLERLIASAEGAGRRGQSIAYLSLQAVAYQAQAKTLAQGESTTRRSDQSRTGQEPPPDSQSKRDKALAYLSRALALAEPEGYMRTFVDLGPPMRELLPVVARQGVASDYVSRLLAAFSTVEPAFVPSPAVPQERREIGGPVEPLGDRERQVLRLLAARLSYREIAEELYLSLNTIKWYVKTIYGKLGVNRRSQAVSRARELGLLSGAKPWRGFDK